MKESSFTLKKVKSLQYPTETITDDNYAVDVFLNKLNLCCIAWSRQQEALVSM